MERNKSRRGQVMREREARKEKEGKSGKKKIRRKMSGHKIKKCRERWRQKISCRFLSKIYIFVG